MPSTVTAEARVALKESPGELIFDPTDDPNRTVSVVPAGTTTGGAGAGAGAAAGAAAGELIALPPALPAVFDCAAMLLAEFAAVSAGLLEHATNVNNRAIVSIWSAR